VAAGVAFGGDPISPGGCTHSAAASLLTPAASGARGTTKT